MAKIQNEQVGVKTEKAKSVKLSRELAEIPIHRYRMAKDTRKWKAVAQNRMALAEFLGNHGDGDGTRIFPAVSTMAKKFGWSESKTYYLLDDLRELRLLEDTPHYSAPKFHRTRVRQLNVSAFLTVQDSKIEVGVQDSDAQMAQDSKIEQESKIQDSKIETQDSKIEVQDSNVTLETTATVNRHSDRHKVNCRLGVHSRASAPDERTDPDLYGFASQHGWGFLDVKKLLIRHFHSSTASGLSDDDLQKAAAYISQHPAQIENVATVSSSVN
jgi:hypothetical protein